MKARRVFAVAVLALASGASLSASLGPVQVYKSRLQYSQGDNRCHPTATREQR